MRRFLARANGQNSSMQGCGMDVLYPQNRERAKIIGAGNRPPSLPLATHLFERLPSSFPPLLHRPSCSHLLQIFRCSSTISGSYPHHHYHHHSLPASASVSALASTLPFPPPRSFHSTRRDLPRGSGYRRLHVRAYSQNKGVICFSFFRVLGDLLLPTSSLVF